MDKNTELALIGAGELLLIWAATSLLNSTGGVLVEYRPYEEAADFLASRFKEATKS